MLSNLVKYPNQVKSEELRDYIERLNQKYKENYEEYLSGSYVREDIGVYRPGLSYDIDVIQMMEARYSTLISKNDFAYFVCQDIFNPVLRISKWKLIQNTSAWQFS